jgi:hypothetical protein
MQDLENHYVTRLQGIRRQGGTVQVYANIPLPLASALDLESGETVTWKVLDRTHLLLVRLPERKQLQGEAVPQPPARKRARLLVAWALRPTTVRNTDMLADKCSVPKNPSSCVV